MPFKKPVFLLSSHSNLFPLCHCHSMCLTSTKTTASPCRPSQRRRTNAPASPLQLQQRSSYATHAYSPPPNDDHNASQSGPHPHHHVWPTDPSPTPYQVLAHPRTATYTKTQFNTLVKVYHPDLNNLSSPSTPSSICALPHPVRLERYRLIVAAHAILSDPAKRKAYDKWGVGWGGGARDISAPGFERPEGRAREEVMRNATWEDWEAWYDKHRPRDSSDGGEGGGSRGSYSHAGQLPAFMTNYAFVSLVVMVASVGWVGQAKRVEAYGERLVQARDFVHDHSSKDLRRARMGSAGSSKDERIESWLRLSDPDLAEEEYGKRFLPPQGEVCLSGVVSGCDVERKDR